MNASLHILHHAALACTACMGAPGDSQTLGMNGAILFLLGVTGLVLLGVVLVAGFIAWREQRAAEAATRAEEDAAWTS